MSDKLDKSIQNLHLNPESLELQSECKKLKEELVEFQTRQEMDLRQKLTLIGYNKEIRGPHFSDVLLGVGAQKIQL